VLIYFIQLICLSYDSGTETAREPGTEAAEEQGNDYDPLFTYKKGDKASYFVILEDSGGDMVDVGPSGDWTSKESLMALSSIGWTTEASVSKGEPDVPSATAKVSSMEPDGISAAVEGVLRETVAKAGEAVSPLGNTLISCKQFSPDIHYVLFQQSFYRCSTFGCIDFKRTS